jgi:DNA polymerase V
MEVSAQVYAIYLRYVSSQDAWPYSVDEAFLDVTPYRAPYGSNARELAHRITSEV